VIEKHKDLMQQIADAAAVSASASASEESRPS